MARQTLPQLIGDQLHQPATDGSVSQKIAVGSVTWLTWLNDRANSAFSIATNNGAVTVRRERQGGGFYWYAYRRQGPKLRKAYLGKSEDLTLARLHSVLESLALPNHLQNTPVGANSVLQIRLFGTASFLRGERQLATPASKAVALLAYLAIQRVSQSRDHLLALLWPESAEEAARKNLRNLLWVIRTALGESVLVSQGQRLALHQEVWVDVSLFERLTEPANQAQAALVEATNIYSGPLLHGLNIADGADFDLWLTAERERFAQRWSRAAKWLVGQYYSQNDWDAATALAQRVLADDSLQEWPYRTLMEASARRGERTAALRQYDALRAMLDREFGAAPTPETEAVHDAIMRGTFERTATRAVRHTPVRMNRPSRAPFVGRTAELGALDAELATATRGSLRIVVLSGEMGIGKSHLWQAWADHIAPNTTVLEARCLASTEQMPFAPLIGLFSHHLWLERFADVADSRPPWLEDLSPLVPSVEEALARPLLSRLQPQDERHRVFEAFAKALLAIAAPPLILFLDDIQWADSATLDWLDYLVYSDHNMPLLLVLAHRSEDTQRPLLQRIAQWDREGFVRRLPLAQLSVDEASTLLALIKRGEEGKKNGDVDVLSFSSSLLLPLSKDVAQLYHASAGNPYFLAELARAGVGNVPTALADLVRARLGALPETARHTLQAAAVLEPDIDAATLWRIAGRDEDETLDALDALLDAAVLVEREDRYGFAHPLVATLVREDLSRARRATLHRRAATALEQAYVGRLPAHAGRIMTHFREAGDMAQAALYAELAGDYALSVAAPAEAAYFYQHALAVEATAGRHMGLGRAHVWRGDLGLAQQAFESAFDKFERNGDQTGMAWVSLQLADLGTMQSHYDTAMHLAERALALAGKRDQAIAAAAHVLISTGLRIQGAPLAQAEAHIIQAVELAEAIGLPDVLTYCYVGLSNIRAEQGDMQGALAAAQQIIRYAQQSGNDFYQAVGYNNAAYRALLLGNYAASRDYVEAGLRLVEKRSLNVPRQWLYSTRGELALAQHNWNEAEDWFTRGIAHAEQNGNHGQIAMYHANLGLVARGRGDSQTAIKLLEQARRETAHETAAFQQAQIDLWLAETYADRKLYSAAGEALQRVEARLAEGMYGSLGASAQALRQQLMGV